MAYGNDEYNGSTAALAHQGNYSNEKGGVGAGKGSNKKKYIIGGTLLGVVAVAAVLGGVLGTQLNKNNNSSTSGTRGAADAAAGGNGLAATTETTVLPNGATATLTSSPAASTSSASTASVSPLATYDWTKTSYAGTLAAKAAGEDDIQPPMIGAAIGNWLVLEQWMDQTWFNSTANNNASIVDEWGLSQALGSSAKDVLTSYWSSWFTEDDMERLYQAGVNHLRLPMGFWAFIDTEGNEPYVSKGGQLDFAEQALAWAHARGMYVIIDLHGLPGSQNGEIISGHLTKYPSFFTDAQQTRSDATVDAALAWIDSSPYRSVVSALGICNEPRPYTQDQFDMLQSYYQRSYDKTMKLSNPIPLQWHHGFPNQILNISTTTYWHDFAASMDPRYSMMEDHPYPGTFPLQTNEQDMLSQVCKAASGYNSFPIPIVVTEWSIRTGVFDASFEREFYIQQMTAWAGTGGGIFWNFKCNNGTDLTTENYVQFSFLDLIDKGSIPLPVANESALDFLTGLGTPCGTPPTVSWANKGSSSNSKAKRSKLAKKF